MRAVEDDAAVTGLRRRPERGIEAQRIAREAARQRESQVGLVDIARADRLLQLREGLRIAAGRKLRFQRADAAATRCARRQPVRHFVSGDPDRFAKQAQPHQRTRTAAAHRRAVGQPVFEREPGLIGDIARQLAAFAARVIGIGKHPGDLFGTVGDEDPARVFEQQGIGCARFTRIVEQDKGLPFRHRCQPLPQAQRLSRDCLTAPTRLRQMAGIGGPAEWRLSA